MPSGYTAELYEGHQSFEDFVLKAARGMGALITMRDTDLSVPAPRRLEPQTKYYETKIETAKERLRYLKSLSDTRLDTEARIANEQATLAWKEKKRSVEAREARYRDMLEKVRAWEVPESLNSFKEFMIEQLEASLQFDTYSVERPVQLSGQEWLEQSIEQATRDIAYYGEQIKEEIRRTNERNAWLDDLWSALDNLYVNA